MDLLMTGITNFFQDFNINLKIEEIDGVCIKKMAASNVLKENREPGDTGKQTHIAITGELRKFFPLITTIEYFTHNPEDKTTPKKCYTYQIPITLLKENLEYLDFPNSEKDIETYTLCSVGHVGKKADYQLQLSKITQDDENFINFRKCIYPNDYLVIIKLATKFQYYFLCLREAEKEKLKSYFPEKEEICYFNPPKRTETIFENKYLVYDDELKDETKENSKNVHPLQQITYGAPGTGKSYTLNEQAKNSFEKENIERVTFYDGYTYGQFVGMFKPDTTPNGDITYSYIPGPFMRQLVKAYKNPTVDYCIIIEEINRAKADKVFGNIFQLLDRDSTGASRYAISTSEDQRRFLEEELGHKKVEIVDVTPKIEAVSDNTIATIDGFVHNYETIKIPRNLYIWATMNSADDGVYAMDSAFKRRWSFRYIGLNENEDKFGVREEYKIGTSKNGVVYWNDFRKALNNKLKNRISEDKLIAPFFISASDFEEESENKKVIKQDIFIQKLLMYIFDDLLKHYPKIKAEIFNSEIKTFSDIAEICKESDSIPLDELFNDEFLETAIIEEEIQEEIEEEVDEDGNEESN